MGNGFRAGAVHDATDRAQIQELIINSELADQAHDFGVQTIVEGPGHIPVDEIEANVKVMKRLSGRSPSTCWDLWSPTSPRGTII